MKSVQLFATTPTPKTNSTTQVVTTEPAKAGSVGTPVVEPHDALDALTEKLCKANPRFSDLLAKAGKDLAPLATTRDGGATITSLRMSAGLTQKQLAEAIGQSQSNISLIESGYRSDLSRNTMRKLCTAFKCDMNTIDAALENAARTLEQHLDEQETTAIDETRTKKNSA